MGLTELFHRKKAQPKEKQSEEIVNEQPDYYTLAMEEIENEKKMEEASNMSELQADTKDKIRDISAFQGELNISFFDPNYSFKIKSSLIKGGFNHICNQLGDLENAYIGHEDLGKISIPSNEKISPMAAELSDKIFMNRAYHKSLEGRLNKLNGLASDYKEFYKKYLKKDSSKTYYENRKSLLTNLEKLSNWIVGEDIEEIKEKIGNINKYLLEEIKEEKSIDNLKILDKRVSNLIQGYGKQFSNEQNPYRKFHGCVGMIDRVLNSVSYFNLALSNETKINFHNSMTKIYTEIQKNENIHDSIKQETKQTYLEAFEKLHGISYEQAMEYIKKVQNTKSEENI